MDRLVKHINIEVRSRFLITQDYTNTFNREVERAKRILLGKGIHNNPSFVVKELGRNSYDNSHTYRISMSYDRLDLLKHVKSKLDSKNRELV